MAYRWKRFSNYAWLKQLLGETQNFALKICILIAETFLLYSQYSQYNQWRTVRYSPGP